MPIEKDSAKLRNIPLIYKGNLRFRFILWITVVLLCTFGGAALYVYQAQQDLLEESLRSKANAIGRFIALISPDAIYAYDVTMLDRFVHQISNDEDVRFAQIQTLEGRPITTYLPDDVQPELVEQWIKQRNTVIEQAHGIPAKLITLDFTIRDGEQVLGWVIVGLDTSRVTREARDVLIDLIRIFTAIVLVLGSVIFVIFKLHVLTPIGALTQGASRVAEGYLDHEVPIYANDELGRLAKSFNDMMDQIVLDREELLETNNRLAEEIEQRHAATEELKKLSLAVEQSPASVVITNLEGNIEYVNPKFCEVSGYSADEVIGKHTRILGAGPKGNDYYRKMWDKLKTGEVWKGEFCNRRKNGISYWESAVIAPIRGENGETTHYLAVKEDITERKAFEQKLLEQATHDQLTGLPNRFLAFDRLQQLLQHAKRHKQFVAVIYIDLDNFKTVNDTMGHPVGDQLLIQVAKRIKAQLRFEDTLARLGGDEFMAMVPDVKNLSTDLERVVNRFLSAMQTPFRLNNREFNITSSLGIAIFPDDGTDVSSLMSNADMAMYEAKHAGRNTFRFFTREINIKVSERMELETHLSHALEAGELYPVYQPIVCVADGSLVGAEVLLRWKNKDLGQVTPAEFIPIAEQTGLIRPITDWLFGEILKHAKSWQEKPVQFWLSVNVPPIYFCDAAFNKTISSIARQANEIDIGLCVEITENLLLHNDEEVLDNFQHLKRLGVYSAMDDFGTGYSSLAYVKRFPLNHLKIDRSFINGLPADADNRTLTEMIVLMSKKLGITIIAEGVENQAQANFLKTLNVEFAQGYHFARPMHHREFENYLSDMPQRQVGS
ncbi:MAG: EAL domain-containing protein [Candidatus Thiodiazotropha sp. (ex Epidulcina cf. delphinae)]|nr:EAL domain-containing protein [Candidatus Thiodiazotropha sp. (ex Epidulcina cf. delphinae)]